MAYLLDSGFLYGFIDDQDEHFDSVSRIFESIREPIHFPVPAITEVAYFVSKNLGAKATAAFLKEVATTDLILEDPTADDYLRSAEIILKYNDAKLDFVDACIFAMAERLNITKILTVDRRHFQIFRPTHCEAFEILP